MRIATIGVEEWLNAHERDAVWDIARSTISPLTVDELRGLDGADGARSPSGFGARR